MHERAISSEKEFVLSNTHSILQKKKKLYDMLNENRKH